ncbi:unnamed protein product [Schistocephalus solidus]|uniref:Sec1 family domain-containing protein 2 n=1 Tax=Schistocephalus solidus TaxID=70667 RepID=A0A183TAA3_SCHSO|nr:unnamed protein product [Schistocephalus solidus]
MAVRVIRISTQGIFIETSQSHQDVTDQRRATVICIDKLWRWDPSAALLPFVRPSSIVDQILFSLSAVCVDWSPLSNFAPIGVNDDPTPFRTPFSLFGDQSDHRLLGDLFCCTKQAEELKLLQKALLDAVFALDAASPDLDLIKRPNAVIEQLRSLAAAVFTPVCSLQKFNYLSVIELALAAAEVLQSARNADATREVTGPLVDSGKGAVSVEHLLRKYENALALAHLDDAAVDLTGDSLKRCRPILLNAIQDATQLTHVDDVFLLIFRLIGLLPCIGCDPRAKQNSPLIEAIDRIISIGVSKRNPDATSHGLKGGLLLNRALPNSMGTSFLSAVHRRHLLPAFRDNVKNVGFPQVISPVVQMFSDFVAARLDPSSASAALQSLHHWPLPTPGTTFLSEMGKWIGMGSQLKIPPFSTDLVVLVVGGTITWSLAREIVFAASKGSSDHKAPLEVLIICDSFLTGKEAITEILEVLPESSDS